MRDITTDTESIRELQRMLRLLHHDDERLPPVNPDGIYGSETANAVSTFQQMYGLPVTGRTDFATWQQISRESRRAAEVGAPPHAISPFPTERGYVIRADEYSDIAALVQFMLRLLAHAYDDIAGDEPDGIYNENTAADVRSFQKRHGLPVTGEVDKATWNALADAYNRLNAGVSAQ